MSATRTLPQIVDVRQHGGVASVALLEADGPRYRGVDSRAAAVRVVEARVLCWTGEPVPPGGSQAVADAVRAFERRQDEAATAVDVAALWEKAQGLGDEVSLPGLAALIEPEPDGSLVSRVLRALIADGLRFRVRATDVQVVSADSVAARLAAEEEEARQKKRQQAFIGWIRGGDGRPPEDGDEQVEQLKQLAARVGQVSSRDPGAAAMLAAGREGTPAAAFRLLVERGLFGEHENLALIRHGLGAPFSDEVARDAQGLAGDLARILADASRRDLRHLHTVSIDYADTREIDDALSVEILGSGVTRVGIHLAEPGALIPVDGPVDRAAFERQGTLYLPEGSVPMLPPGIGQGAATLARGEDRPSLSVLIDFDAGGREVDVELCRSVVRVDEAVPYPEMDRRLAEGRAGELATAWRLAQGLRERRLAAGALETSNVGVNPEIDAGGRLSLHRVDPATPAHRMVAEWAIRANRAAAALAVDAGLPVPFRSQALSEPWPADLDPADPYQVFCATRCLDQVRTDTSPGPHAGLGVDAYLQFTSPLRRYLDLLAQRQISAHLAGEAPPLDGEAFRAAIAAAEPVIARSRIVSAGSREYWMLRWLEDHGEAPLPAVVLEVRRRRVRVELLDLALRAWWRPEDPVEPGARVELEVAEVDARAGVLVLRATG